jgi:cellulose biosynthesis protein BcsQ
MHGQAGTTSNLLAIAIVNSLEYHYKNLITQTHFSLNNLEAPLLTKTSLFTSEFYMDVGIDALSRSIKSEKLDTTIIEDSTISLLEKKLNLLPGTTKLNRELYEGDISKTISNILHATATCHDIVFIDTNSGDNKLSMNLLQSVDLIVVNLSQNKSLIEDYILNYNFNNKKVFYLFGNYDKNSKYNIKNLMKSYSWLNKNNSGVIPYNTEYKDAISDGQVISFFFRNSSCDKEDCNGYFMYEINSTIKKMVKFAGIERRIMDGIYY